MLKNNLKYFEYFTVCKESGILIVKGTLRIDRRMLGLADIFVYGKYVWFDGNVRKGYSGTLNECTLFRPANEIEIELFKRQYNES